MKCMSKLILSELLFSSTILEILGECKFHLDERIFFFREFQEVLNRSDFPASFLKFFFLCFFHGLSNLVISFESLLTSFYYTFRSFLRFLAKNVNNYYRIFVDPVYDSPSSGLIDNPKFMTPPTNGRHRSRMGKAELLPELKLAKQIACFKTGCLGKRWSSYFAFKPDERLVLRFHHLYYMSYMTYCQVQ